LLAAPSSYVATYSYLFIGKVTRRIRNFREPGGDVAKVATWQQGSRKTLERKRDFGELVTS
jgi:hypothetical protein